MNTPAQPPSSMPTHPKSNPVFRTASGERIEAKPGQRVVLQDLKREVDICIVFDTTGSMRDKINGLVQCIVTFIEELAKLRLDWRLTAVPFGDLTVRGDRIVSNLPFATDAPKAKAMIQEMPLFHGGGNEGESSLEALQAALGKAYRPGAVKVLLLFTDEPPLQASISIEKVARSISSKEFVCFVVSNPRQGFERFATENAGKWYPIGTNVDTSGLLRFLKGLLTDVALVSKAVHELGGGSVPKYIAEVKRQQLGK